MPHLRGIVTALALSMVGLSGFTATNATNVNAPARAMAGPDVEQIAIHIPTTMPPTTTTTTIDLAAARRELARASARRIAIERQRQALLAASGQPADREVILACIRAHEGGGYTTVSATGKYRGAYQMDSSFWASYGDGSAPTADQATVASQDDAAWRGYLARGYGPWPPSQGGRCP